MIWYFQKQKNVFSILELKYVKDEDYYYYEVIDHIDSGMAMYYNGHCFKSTIKTLSNRQILPMLFG